MTKPRLKETKRNNREIIKQTALAGLVLAVSFAPEIRGYVEQTRAQQDALLIGRSVVDMANRVSHASDTPMVIDGASTYYFDKDTPSSEPKPTIVINAVARNDDGSPKVEGAYQVSYSIGTTSKDHVFSTVMRYTTTKTGQSDVPVIERIECFEVNKTSDHELTFNNLGETDIETRKDRQALIARTAVTHTILEQFDS